MHDEQTFPAGTIAECNRCKQFSPLPKPCLGHLEAPTSEFLSAVYRLDTMCLLGCGHMDAHWVLVTPEKEASS